MGDIFKHLCRKSAIPTLYLGLAIGLMLTSYQPIQSQHSIQKIMGNTRSFRPIDIPGLGDFAIIDIYKDSHGFLWFATEGGLYRYGGGRARAYVMDPADSTRLTSNTIKSLYEDRNQHLWAVTNGVGANRINLQTGRLTPFQEASSPKLTSHLIADNLILDFVDSRDGSYWLVGQNTGSKITFHGTSDSIKITRLNFDKLLDSIPYKDIAESVRRRSEFLGWKNGLIIFDPVGDQFYRASLSGALAGLNDFKPRLNKFKATTTIRLIDSSLTLYDIHSAPFKISRFSLNSVFPNLTYSKIKDFYHTNRSTTWIMTDGQGIYKVDLTNKTGVHYFDTGDEQRTINGNTVYTVFEDEDRNLWASTNAGLQVLPQNNPSFARILPVSNQPARKKSNAISALLLDHRQRLWISTKYGVHWFNRVEERITNNIHRSNLPSELGDLFIRTMYQDQQNNFWFGTEQHGLWQADSGLTKFQHYPLPHPVQTMVRDITEDHKGRVWFGVDYNRGGLFYYDKSTDRIRRSNFPGYSAEDSYPKHITALHFNNMGRLWVGTWNEGLFLLDFKEGYTRHYHPNKIESGGRLSNNIITDIALTKNREIWVGTWEKGINYGRWSERSSQYHFRELSSEHGIQAPNVHSMQPDKNGNLWLTAGDDLYKIETAPSSAARPGYTNRNSLSNGNAPPIYRFSENNGLNAESFIMGSKTHGPDGRLYFGSDNGVIHFDPTDITPETDTLPIHLTGLRIKNEPAALDTLISFKNGLVLDHRQNFLTFEFAAQEYIEPESVVYEYRLTGVDNHWVQSASPGVGKANYTQLSPGNYIFKVRGRFNSNRWQGTFSIPVTITPPFWRTWWFLMIAGLAAVGGFIALIRRISYNQLKKKNRRLEIQRKIQLERERISRDLHDNVGAHITNLINGLEMTQYQFKQGKSEEASQTLETLNQEARYIMTELRETIWLMGHKSITVEEFVRHLRRYLRKQLITNAGLSIYVQSQLQDNLTLKPTTSLHILRIIQEAFTNTCKYADANTFSVSIEDSNHREDLEVTIRDDGKGMDPTLNGEKGNGLQNMKKRAKQLSGALEIQSQPDRGTLITLRIPIPPESGIYKGDHES